MEDKRVILPSQRAAARKERQEESKQPNEDLEYIRACISRIAQSDDGQIFLRWLMDQCSFGESKVAFNMKTGEISEKQTLYNSARETVILDILSQLDQKQLATIIKEK